MEDKLEQSARAGNGAAIVVPAFYENEFGTGFGDQKHAQTVKKVMPGPEVWAEAHGGELALVWPCGCTRAAATAVNDTVLASGDQADPGVRHTFTPGDSQPARVRHKIPGANRRTFPNLFTFNFPEIEDPNNDFGQPKLYALIERHHQKKPWDLDFTFRFTGQGGAYKPDQGTQVALGSSIVYYHRPGAWAEPPNFLNPFWRATLYAADDDVAQELSKAGYTEQSDAVNRLMKQGLKVVTR
jgi:hypothetical protein